MNNTEAADAAFDRAFTGANNTVLARSAFRAGWAARDAQRAQENKCRRCPACGAEADEHGRVAYQAPRERAEAQARWLEQAGALRMIANGQSAAVALAGHAYEAGWQDCAASAPPGKPAAALPQAAPPQGDVQDEAEKLDFHEWKRILMRLVDEHWCSSSSGRHSYRARIMEHAAVAGRHWKAVAFLRDRGASSAPPAAPIFALGDRVRKTKGSSWQGMIVGTYSTTLTPEGYAVESEREPGSVQIYPVTALEKVDSIAPPAAPVLPVEPVAWQYRRYSLDPDDEGWGIWQAINKAEAEFAGRRPNTEVRALYAAPPSALPELTDEQIIAIRQATRAGTEPWADTIAFARAVLAAAHSTPPEKEKPHG